MTRNDAINLARAHALAHGQDHAYLPATDSEAAEWLPHAWVVDAIVAAFGAGQNKQAAVTEKAFEALNRNADLGERAEADAKKLRAALTRIEAAQALGTAHALAKMALRGFECEDCIGMMREHGCYCEVMGAVQPGGPGA